MPAPSSTQHRPDMDTTSIDNTSIDNTADSKPLDNKMLRRLRRIAHHLNPVVSIGDAGLTDAVVGETERALSDHELIKVKIHSESRDERKALTSQLAQRCEARLVQSIGKVAILYKDNPKPNPNLSNVLRHTLAGGKG